MTADRILADTFAAHEHLAPDPDATLAEVTRRLDRRRPARGGLAAVTAAAAVVAVATGATLLAGDRPAGPDGSAAVSPPDAGEVPPPVAVVLSLTPGWLPPGRVDPEFESFARGVQGRGYQIARPGGMTLHLGLSARTGTALPTSSHVEGRGRDLTVAGRPAREWLAGNQYDVAVALPQRRIAQVTLLQDGTAADLAEIGREVAARLRTDRPVRMTTSYQLTAVPPGREVVAVNATYATGTSYSLAAPGTPDTRLKGHAIYVRQINESWRTMTWRDGPPATTPGRPVQSRPTLVHSEPEHTLWVDEIRPGVSIQLTSDSPDVSLADLYRIADGIRWTG